MNEKKAAPPAGHPRRKFVVIAVEMMVWILMALTAGVPFFLFARRVGLEMAIIEKGNTAVAAILAILLPIFVILVEGRSPLQALLWRFAPFVLRSGGEVPLSRAAIDLLKPKPTDRTTERQHQRIDPIEEQLSTSFQRSNSLAAATLRRSNVHLLLGASVGLTGLLFFYFMTGPKFLPPVAAASWPGIIANVANALPRVTILVFVELMAAFFLKQYRAAMEEFRYYEEVLRNREAALIAYFAASAAMPNQGVLALSMELLQRTTFGVLKQGETTAVVETARLSENEVTALISAVSGAVERTVRLATGKPEEKKNASPPT